MEPKIIYEDENFIAVNKPAGMLVHPINGREKEPILVSFITEKYPEIKDVGDQPETRPGIVHRLDRDTSGVILVARNQRYFEYLKNLFQTRQIKKTYLALVLGKLEPKQGIIEKPISLKTGSVKRTVWEGKDAKPAVTEYKVKKYFSFDGQDYSLVEAFPKTGRTHQIRIHFSSTGHPIIGDKLYGSKKSNPPAGEPFNLNRQFLHAQSLEFTTEDGKRMKVEADLPEELEKIIDSLSNNR